MKILFYQLKIIDNEKVNFGAMEVEYTTAHKQ